jgi:hypothetical protein
MRAELKDFSGGITDFIFTSDPTCSAELENIIITKDKGLETRWGSRLMDPSDSKPVTTVTTPNHITEFRGEKVEFFGGQILTWDGSTWTEVIGKGAPNKCLTEAFNTTKISFFEWNKHLFITDDAGSKSVKMFKDGDGDYQLVTSGLPEVASLPTVTPSSADGKTYIYYYAYYYEYFVGDIKFIDYGPTIQHIVSNAADMDGSQNNITAIPVLANTSRTHYDVDNIKVRIFRTVDTGTEGYLVGEVTNGTTTFADNKTDEDLVLGELIYNSSGASDNYQPPVSRYLDMSNNCGWYANTELYPYRVYQSQIGDPDSVPDDYYTEFEEEILGISSFQSNPIIFTENQLWRIEGVIGLDGSGNQEKRLVADAVSSINHLSIVKTDKGVFFAGPDSFYWTDGYQIKKVPGEEKNFPTRYKGFSGNPDSIKGSYDRLNNRVMWTTKTSVSRYEIYVYDITFNSFTTWTGDSGNFKPTSILCSKDRTIYRTDESGYTFVHEPILFQDPIIDTDTSSVNWQNTPVIQRFKHIAYDFGVSDIHKWATKVTVSGEGKTNLDIQVNSYDDSNVNPKALTPITHRSGLVWNDQDWLYGDNASVWGLELRLSQTRFFKSGKIRCKRKQLEITNAKSTITGSIAGDVDTYASYDSGTKVLTIADTDKVFIPTDSIGKTITIAGKDYVVDASNDNSFTIIEPSGLLATGVYEWSMTGFPSNQRFHLESIIFSYETLDDKGGYFQKGVTIND